MQTAKPHKHFSDDRLRSIANFGDITDNALPGLLVCDSCMDRFIDICEQEMERFEEEYNDLRKKKALGTILRLN